VRQFGGDLRIRMGARGTMVHAVVPVGHTRRRRAPSVRRSSRGKSRRAT
jgi:signal transduction histidine kinase